MNQNNNIEVKCLYGNKLLPYKILKLIYTLDIQSTLITITFNDIFEDILEDNSQSHIDLLLSSHTPISRVKYDIIIQNNVDYIWITSILKHFKDVVLINTILSNNNINYVLKYSKQFNIRSFLRKNNINYNNINKNKELKYYYNLIYNIKEFKFKLPLPKDDILFYVNNLHEL